MTKLPCRCDEEYRQPGLDLQTPLFHTTCQEKSQVFMARFLPKLNAVRAFESAGRHGSFSRAAAELNVSHAAISRHVRGLEADLGVQLFKVIARGVELTDAGRLYLSKVEPALDEISAASEVLRERDDASISVTCEPTFAGKWLMPNLGHFKRAYPDVSVRLESAPKLADIRNFEFDIAVRYCRAPATRA